MRRLENQVASPVRTKSPHMNRAAGRRIERMPALAALQRSAGNQAVAQLLHSSSAVSVQRDKVLNLDPGDTIIDKFSDIFESGGAVKIVVGGKPDKKSFRDLRSGETVYIVGHGLRSGHNSGPCVTVGGLPPAELASLIVQLGLPEDFDGLVYVDGCHSGFDVDEDGHEIRSYIDRFRGELAKFGRDRVRIKGNLGRTHVADGGVHQIGESTPEAEEALDRAENLVNEENTRLMAESADKSRSLSERQAALAQYGKNVAEAKEIRARYYSADESDRVVILEAIAAAEREGVSDSKEKGCCIVC